MRPNSLKAKLRAGQRVVGAPVAPDHDDGRRFLADGWQAPFLANALRSLQVLRT